MILLIDNYDSFVHNLARYFQRLGQQTRVVRNDAVTSQQVRDSGCDAVVLSPGPCTPNEAGNSLEIVTALLDELPMLGICLGHQTIVQALGGRIIRAPGPVHGRASSITHSQEGVFAQLPNPTNVARYHSLVADPLQLPAQLEVTATCEQDECIMAVRHRRLPVVGLQFHPESVLTDSGYLLLANFLRIAGLPAPKSIPPLTSERPPDVANSDDDSDSQWHVTF